MENKLKKAFAILGTALIGVTSTGCTEQEIRDEYNKEKESVLDDIDEMLIKRNKDLKNYIDGLTTTETTTETTYTQSLETTTETVTTTMTNPTIITEILKRSPFGEDAI